MSEAAQREALGASISEAALYSMHLVQAVWWHPPHTGNECHFPTCITYSVNFEVVPQV